MDNQIINITDIQRDSQAFTDAILNTLETNPSVDQVEQFIGQLAEIKTLSQWAIGDVLVFMRYFSQFTPRGVWRMINSQWPPELVGVVHERFDQNLQEEEPETKEWLSWMTHRYERFWVLVRGDEVRLWERNSIDWLDDVAFEEYVRQLSGRLREVLDYNSLLVYYYTSSAFPCSTRHPHISWTAHSEVTHIAGQQVPATVRGLARLEAKSEIAPKLLNEFEEQDITTVTKLRSIKREMAQKATGYYWDTDVPEFLYVVDNESGARYAALRFKDNLTASGIEGARKIIDTATIHGYSPYAFPYELAGDDVRMLSGEVIATFENADIPIVTTALSALAAKLKFIIPY